MPILQGIIEHERRNATLGILESYRERYHSNAVLLPNARFGLYAAARELLCSGDTVLISPVTCRTVIEALRLAEMRPVFVDIELETGNIDISRLRHSELNRARAIVTTNLYGNPDRTPELKALARRHNLLLIEDCAHVLHTVIGGRRVGSIGDVSVFSFKKFFDQQGGVLTARSRSAADRIAARVAAETLMPSRAEELRDYLRLSVKCSPGSLAHALAGRMWQVPAGEPLAIKGHRPATDNLKLPTSAALLRVAGSLNCIDAFIATRIAETAALAARCPLQLKVASNADQACLLVVPFFCEQRDAVVNGMQRQGIPTWYRYTPPMNEVYEEYAVAGRPDPIRVRTWCDRILPVNPRFARQYLETIARIVREDIRQSESNTICKI